MITGTHIKARKTKNVYHVLLMKGAQSNFHGAAYKRYAITIRISYRIICWGRGEVWVKGAPTRSSFTMCKQSYWTIRRLSCFQGPNGRTCSSYIDAAYRFFRTRCEDELISRRGLASDKNKKKRRHERIVRVRMFFMYCFSYM